MSKYGYLRDALVARNLLPSEGGYLAPSPAEIGRVSAVHALDYVTRAFDVALTSQEERRIGLPNTPQVIRRARLSAAGTTLAARLALEHGIACNMAGGSHHAGPDEGAGFCVFNDVAVAARALLDDCIVSRVLVLDCDVHQGDGTARIFSGDPRVFTVSLHAEKNYPAHKAQSDLDIALPDGLADAAYLESLRHALPEVLERVKPQIVFYNAGVDPYLGDKLGRLGMSLAGLRARDAYVLKTICARDIPITGVLGGGYSQDPTELAARHAILFEEGYRVWKRELK